VSGPGTPRGFTLIEVLVAVLLLSTMALTLSRTLIASQRARATSERWTQAAQLAAEGVEQLRTGQALGPVRIPGDFGRRAAVTAWNGHDRLVQLVVTVSWNDGSAHDFQLSTLARR
jgi:prepilin-type N-terminal cleavage/methylation domain-containing protein